VLLPFWRRLRPHLDPANPHSPAQVRIRTGRLARRIVRGSRIAAMREPEYLTLVRRSRYYRGRWPYMSVACAAADDLIERYRLRTALELGPHLSPIVVGADVMDVSPSADLRGHRHVIVHDATAVPWPIEDRAYGLFVGLQVFEHLRDRQREAFAEVRRVADHAIISLPIDWQMPDPRDKHHGISHETAMSWFAPSRPTRIEVGTPAPRKRLVYVFEDLGTGGATSDVVGPDASSKEEVDTG
jgi:hypothetical protein